MIFNLFSKNKKGLVIHDKIWATERAKFDACAALKKSDQNVMFIAWFEETKKNLEIYFKENNIAENIYLAKDLGMMQQDKNFIFIEHHPLKSEEQRLATHFMKNEITVLSALSEPIFQLFGSDRIVDLLKKLGMKDDEMIEHNMISNSIIKTQEKIASKSNINISGKSQKEWLTNANIDKF